MYSYNQTANWRQKSSKLYVTLSNDKLIAKTEYVLHSVAINCI